MTLDQTQTTQLATAPAPAPEAVPNNPTTQAGKMLQALMEKNQLFLPANYSVENALKAAWLVLQTVEDKDKKRALDVCTRDSIVNSLFEMAVQALDPMKKQCYFIVHGNQLTCRRSYFGDEALAKRVKPGIEAYYDVVRAGDTFKTKKQWVDGIGLATVVVEHEQSIGGEILGAYCGFMESETNKDLGIIFMDMARIRKSWGMGQTSGKLQTTFSDEACLRTVIRRRCKPIINSSDDSTLLSVLSAQDESIEAEMADTIALEANNEPVMLVQTPAQVIQPAAVQSESTIIAPEVAAAMQQQQQAPEVPPTPPAQELDF